MTEPERFFALPPLLNEWISEDELADIVDAARAESEGDE